MKKASLVLSIVLVSCLIVVPAFAIDSDSDGIPDEEDNCPSIYNPGQEDTMPSGGGNSCGDACECEGDLEPDGDVDGTDAVAFKHDFFRKDCVVQNPCNGDFECDGGVDGTDAFKFKADFFRKDCPSCGGCTCVYPESSGCGFSSGFTTGERTIMSNDVERVYYLKLPESYDDNTTYPLVVGFHGTGGDYTSFTENSYYNLHGAVGEEAILVYPNALLNSNEVTQWNYDTDLIFFDDLYQELETNLCIDVWKVFTTGHSSGGGMSHFLGCERGDVLRAIGPVAGSLVDYLGCIGQVAVIQIQGSEDTVVPLEMIIPTRDYWVAINSCNSEETHVGVDPICVAYDDCDLNFPVQYCEHSGGHEWPDFAGDAIWNFFESLPLTRPSSETGTGEIPNFVPGTISFKINYPSDFVGTPYKIALSLYPPDTTQPLYTSPSHFLNTNVPVGDYQFGEIMEYNNVPINLYNVAFDDYTLNVVIYVEGGNYPIPTTGVDYVGLINITLDSDIITVVTPIDIEFLQSF